jgi:hypothetical protein
VCKSLDSAGGFCTILRVMRYTLKRWFLCLAVREDACYGECIRRHGENRVRQLLSAMEPHQTLLARTFDHLHWTQRDRWPLSLQTFDLRFCAVGYSHPGVPNGVLYAPGDGCSWAHRKRGADLVCGVFLSGGSRQSAPPGKRGVFVRLIERLMMQVEHVLVANQLTVVTKEVIETARENLIIGFN